MKNKLFHLIMFSILLGAIAFVAAGPGPLPGTNLQLDFTNQQRALMASHNFVLIGFSEIRCDIASAGTCESDLIYRERGLQKMQRLNFPHGTGVSTSSATVLENRRNEVIVWYVNQRIIDWQAEDDRRALLNATSNERRGNVPVGPGGIIIR